MFWYGFFSFFSRVISELRPPIGAKFCTMLGAAFNFIIPVQNFGGATSKFGGKYLRNGDIQNRWVTRLTAIPPALGETSPVKIGPVTLEI